MPHASPAHEPPLLVAFADQVRHDNPMHRSFLDQALANLTPLEKAEIGEYIAFCNSRGLAIEYLAKCYLTVVADTLREQIYFQRHGKYRYATFAEVAGHVYFDPEYMADYMHGLALSSYLWPNHLELFRFFRASLPTDRRGSYLEIGPGHGYFFKTAMQLSRYDAFHGVDISATSIGLTRDLVERYGGDRTAQVRLECLDFLEADLPRAGFAAIVMGEVLEHVEQPERFLRKLASLAADDAFLFVTTCINAPAIDHIRLFRDPRELQDMFVACGLAIRQQRICPHAGKTLDECLGERYAVNVGYVLERTRAPA